MAIFLADFELKLRRRVFQPVCETIKVISRAGLLIEILKVFVTNNIVLIDWKYQCRRSLCIRFQSKTA